MAEYINIASINFDARYAGTYEVDVKQDGSYSATFNMGNKELFDVSDEGIFFCTEKVED